MALPDASVSALVVAGFVTMPSTPASFVLSPANGWIWPRPALDVKAPQDGAAGARASVRCTYAGFCTIVARLIGAHGRARARDAAWRCRDS